MPPRSFPLLRVLLATVLALAGGAAARAQSTLPQTILPTGGHVVAGGASIGAPAGNTLSITQTSPKAVVNWNSFSVGEPNTVAFNQPGGSAAILNRVTGTTPSTIAGQINANGQVYLVNPNGIAITPSGSVQVGGGFVASTLGISNQDFMNGNLSFTGNGASAGVSNAGSITAGPGGYVGLIGGTAANSGTISVPLGKVALGSGEAATFDLNGGGFLQVAAPTGATTAKGQALVSNSGKVSAAGGTVELKAATVATAIRDAVNMSGTITATSVSGRNGAITLSGGPGGAVSVGGTLDASAPVAANQPQGNGGAITVSGARVRLGHHAVLDASGLKGGTVLVGATAPGGQGEAQSTTIASGAQILAAGDPAAAGSGGYIETSGGTLTLGQAVISAGNGGAWLTDPVNLTIDATAATTIDNALAAGTNVTEMTTATGASGAGTASSGNGDIDVMSALAWNTSATLTLSAYNSVNINAPITLSGAGTLVLTYNNNQGGTSTGGALSFVVGQGSAQFTNEGANPSLFINNGTPGSGNGTQYTLLFTESAIDGMASSGNYALAAPLTFANSYTVPVVASFSGNFNGLGNAISNLTINSSGDAGLFGSIAAGGTVANIGISSGTITDTGTNSSAGALAASNSGTISNSYSAATMTDGSANAVITGGLVGSNGGTITTSFATGTVNGGTGAPTGGLVGNNGGAITQSYATGAVSTVDNAITGGLVGQTSGAISNAYATGAVSCAGTGCALTGGFVGEELGSATIANAYSTGTVTASSGRVGGFIGGNLGTLTNTYWDTVTSGTGTGDGGNFGTGSPTGADTATLAGSTVLAVLNTGGTVWANFNNRTSPYLINNTGPVYIPADSNTALFNLVFTPAQLQAIGASGTTLAENYALAQDIDMTGVANFTPIGENTAFSGVFNGLGNVVSNLTINDNIDIHVGLFGQNTGTIENVGLIGGSVFAGNATAVGSLLASNSGGTLTNVYSTASVSGAASNAGGLVGSSAPNGPTNSVITNAYFTGTINMADDFDVGGLVGFNEGTVNNSYVTGSVKGVTSFLNYVGGVVGEMALGTSSMTNVYDAGPVTGFSGNTGAITGNNIGTITNAFWDSDRAGATGIANNTGTVIGGGLLSGTQPFTASSYTGFTFTTTPGATGNNWVIVDTDGTLNNFGGAPGGTLPILAGEYQTVIQNAHQLQLIDMSPAGSYTLGRSIDASATGTSTGPTTGTDVWGCGSAPCTGTFVPIGGNVANYSGTFNGLGNTGLANTISNLTINSSLNNAGLFATTTGVVENVGLLGGSVTDTSNSATVGALVGTNIGTISNTYSTASVTGGGTNDTASGLVGSNIGSITQSFASGAVTAGAASNIGGLAGFSDRPITQSFATGPVSGTTGLIGGLVGLNGGPLTDVYATGSVTANVVNVSDAAGGLVGDNAGGTITDAYATGVVNGNGGAQVGGLVGENFGPVVDGYYDSGTTGMPLGTQADGSVGLTTAALQSFEFTDTANFQNNTLWEIVSGKSYPYLCWQFAGCGVTPQIVSGIVFKDMAATTNAGAGITVTGLINGSQFNSLLTGGTVTTGANGYYYYLLAPNRIPSNGGVLTYA